MVLTSTSKYGLTKINILEQICQQESDKSLTLELSKIEFELETLKNPRKPGL